MSSWYWLATTTACGAVFTEDHYVGGKKCPVVVYGAPIFKRFNRKPLTDVFAKLLKQDQFIGLVKLAGAKLEEGE